MSDYQPPTLTAFLDAGGDLTGWPRLACLAEDAIIEIPGYSPGYRFRAVVIDRAYREWALDQDDQAFATFCQWSAELTEDLDGSLTERLRAAIPAQLRDACDETATKARSPHPLRTGDPCDEDAVWWRCDNCGAAFDQGHAALTVGDRPGYSDLESPIRYCASCITAAASALDVLEGTP